ncbi:MAG: corrinoid protein [Deltaproteobacteria bacterium]|jgi:5-methyltetrahydrofolate--homocysteine methyltransferase|nr:corrinoid protein [Deltaproteobacteria bacterium]MDP3040178.1 corrinoid protein [Deltaproteobacteria bacterium]
MLKPEDFYRVLREVEFGPIEELVKKALSEGHSAPQVLNEGLIAGMSIIGQEFKARDLWVPDVLLAARNMHRGIEILKPMFPKEGSGSKGKIVLGTVKGDIHDIGKNLVSIMMIGSGFEVVDLGVDVPAEKFVATIKEHQPQIIGLSALLTTTMLEMRKVIEAIKASSFDVKPYVIVGGAPMTEAFAQEIGADGYGADAVSGVEVVMKLLKNRV